MTKTRWLLCAAPMLLAGSASIAHAATTERLTIVSNGDTVGSVAATTDGDRVSVDYQVSNNGRGPKHHEDIVLGPQAIPIAWTVDGTSEMGGPVAERFTWAGGTAKWTSQADTGEIKAARPPLYILNDDSPWALGVYAQASLANGGKPLAVAPGGKLDVARLREATVGSGKAATQVAIYRLSGLQIDPGYVVLDKAGRLFAVLGRETAIRAGYEKEIAGLNAIAQALEAERIQSISAKVAHRFEQPVRIRNVHVLDPRTGTRGALSTVVVMRDRITAILPGDGGTPPEDQVVIEGEGGTLYPGLHDMHSHSSSTSGLFYLAAGVTATRDMGNENGFLQALLPSIEAGRVAGPRIVPDGFIEGESPYAARYGFVVSTLEEGLNAVRWYADRGYFEIKLYNSMNPAFVKPLADEAKRLGMGVTGHVPAFTTPDQMIRDGYDTIAHANQLMLGWILDPKDDTRTPLRLTAMARAGGLDLASPRVRTTVDLMKTHHVSLDTTAVILERLMLSRAGTVAEGDAFYLSHMPIGYQRFRRRSFVGLTEPGADAAYRSGFAKVIDVMRMLHDEGIRLLPGTDDGTGFTVQREVQLYARAMGNADALKAATWDCEDYFGNTHQAGTIERGKLAEMVLVAGDPLTDITEIQRPRMVLKGGAVYFPSEIYSALSIAPIASPPSVRPAKAPSAAAAAGAGALFGAPLHDHQD